MFLFMNFSCDLFIIFFNFFVFFWSKKDEQLPGGGKKTKLKINGPLTRIPTAPTIPDYSGVTNIYILGGAPKCVLEVVFWFSV